MHLPSLKQLQYLTALADHGSFSEAAAQCHVTQSTLSAGIASLENLLGQKLVDRSQRASTLTPLGLETVERARKILSDSRDLVTRVRALDMPLSGPLRLGIIPTIAPYLLPQILPGLQSGFPQLELHMHEDMSARLVESLRQGQLDMIVLALPYDTDGMVQEKLFSEQFMLAAPKGQWAGHDPARLDDLDGEALLLLEDGHCLRDHALAACNLKPRRQRQAFNASSLPTLIQMVSHGYGLTLLPEMAVRWSDLPRSIEIIPFAKPCPTRDIGLAWRRNHPRHDDFIRLAHYIREQTIFEKSA